MFDLTDRDSFDSLSYWLNCLREHADEHLVIALMGKLYQANKCTIANKYDLVMEDESQRKVTKLEIMKFASSNDLLYIGESSALADINIKETVENLMESTTIFMSITSHFRDP